MKTNKWGYLMFRCERHGECPKVNCVHHSPHLARKLMGSDSRTRCDAPEWCNMTRTVCGCQPDLSDLKTAAYMARR